METFKKRYGFLVYLLIFVFIFTTCFSIASAKVPKVLVDDTPSSTDIFVMGDQRMVAMFSDHKDCYNMPGTGVAVSSGHYLGSSSNGIIIDTNTNMSKLRENVVTNLEERGKAYIFVVASINIKGCGKTDVEKHVRAQLDAAQRMIGWSCKKNGKTIKPVIYATSLVNKKGISSANYNKALKDYLSMKKYNCNGRIKYLKLPNNVGYKSDTVMFSKAGNNKVWLALHKAAGHRYKAYTSVTKATLSKNGKKKHICAIAKCRSLKAAGWRQYKTVYRISTLKLSKTSFPYTGKLVKPAKSLIIKDSKGKVVPANQYGIYYYNNKAIGKATMGIEAKKLSFYQFTKYLSFNIVEVKVQSISLITNSVTIRKGETINLGSTARVIPSNATNKKLTWSTNNKNIATVSEKGVVTGKGTGSCEITAKANNGVYAKCKVTVKK